MKARFVTYVAAGLLTAGTVWVGQPALAADGGVPGTDPKPENIPHVQTGRPVPIPHYWQPDGPWATPPPPLKVANGPSVENEFFCVSGAPNGTEVCLDVEQLLRVLHFDL